MILNETTKVYNILSSLYGEIVANEYVPQIINKIKKLHKVGHELQKQNIGCDESILITYGDSIYNESSNENTLKTLHKFLYKYLNNSINTVHILPFFPYTSDDGFSIVDYKEVNEKLGNWSDIKKLNKDFNLMFDLVANHISKSSEWFKGYLNCQKPYKDYFITCDESEDYSNVFRPRALPLLTDFETKEGHKSVWTTFSEDQVDLNYKNPELLMQILDVFVFYVEKGATYIRLDAIAFIWKELGTPCIHKKQTHDIIKLIKLMIDLAKVDVKLITETNVPHKDNISYFGNGYNEASMVYNFPLPPLTLYTFMMQDASIILNWVSSLYLPSNKVSFFNFLASHDGIGLLPAKGLIEDDNIKLMAEKVKSIGGFVSYKTESDGNKSPYEMNINYFDALKISCEVDEDLEIKRFLASQSILLCLKGIPGIYIHSIIGSRNWLEGVKLNNSNRSINREKIEYNSLIEKLSDENSTRYKILSGYKKLLALRKSNKCFSPSADQCIIENLDKRIFAIKRSYENESVICLTNVSNSKVLTNYKNNILLDGNKFNGELEPYQIAWFIEEE